MSLDWVRICAVGPRIQDHSVGHGKSAISVHVDMLDKAVCSGIAVINNCRPVNGFIAVEALRRDIGKVRVILCFSKSAVIRHGLVKKVGSWFEAYLVETQPRRVFS